MAERFSWTDETIREGEHPERFGQLARDGFALPGRHHGRRRIGEGDATANVGAQDVGAASDDGGDEYRDRSGCRSILREGLVLRRLADKQMVDDHIFKAIYT